jgi:hypothetical protein
MGSLRNIRSEAAREYREKYGAVWEEVLTELEDWYEYLALHLLEKGPRTKQELLDIDILSARIGSETFLEYLRSDRYNLDDHPSAEFSDDDMKNLVQDCLEREFGKEYKEYILEDLVNHGVRLNGDLYVYEDDVSQ